jgi:hypothetical protein
MSLFLYLKTHSKTGLKYLGKTSQDPHKYRGSGKRWINHLNKHGDDVSTEILAECTTNEEVAMLGQHYSELWDVANSEEFANLKPETGDGGSYPHTEVTKRKIAKSKQGRAAHNKGTKVSTETVAKISKSKQGANNPMFGKVVINNGSENLVIGKDDILPTGYVRGSIQNSENKKTRNAMNTQENNPNFKSFWITDGVNNKMIKHNEIIPDGWCKGRKL